MLLSLADRRLVAAESSDEVLSLSASTMWGWQVKAYGEGVERLRVEYEGEAPEGGGSPFVVGYADRADPARGIARLLLEHDELCIWSAPKPGCLRACGCNAWEADLIASCCFGEEGAATWGSLLLDFSGGELARLHSEFDSILDQQLLHGLAWLRNSDGLAEFEEENGPLSLANIAECDRQMEYAVRARERMEAEKAESRQAARAAGLNDFQRKLAGIQAGEQPTPRFTLYELRMGMEGPRLHPGPETTAALIAWCRDGRQERSYKAMRLLAWVVGGSDERKVRVLAALREDPREEAREAYSVLDRCSYEARREMIERPRVSAAGPAASMYAATRRFFAELLPES